MFQTQKDLPLANVKEKLQNISEKINKVVDKTNSFKYFC